MIIPASALAWGPLTHVFLGSELLAAGALLPAGIYGLLRKYREDFIYGNLMADTIIGKKYIKGPRHPHSWELGMELYESSGKDHEKAFSLGYLSHLAADTVAHGEFVENKGSFGHALVELKAEGMIERKHWIDAMTISGEVQRRNDGFLEGSLESAIFTPRTSRRIFKGMVVLSGLNDMGPAGYIRRRKAPSVWSAELKGHHDESIARMADIIKNRARSHVTVYDPMGRRPHS